MPMTCIPACIIESKKRSLSSLGIARSELKVHSCTIRQRIRYGTRIRYAYRTAIGFGLPYRYTSIRLPAARLPPYPVWMQLTAWLVSCQDECTVHS